jgi:hypothetical protein
MSDLDNSPNLADNASDASQEENPEVNKIEEEPEVKEVLKRKKGRPAKKQEVHARAYSAHPQQHITDQSAL